MSSIIIYFKKLKAGILFLRAAVMNFFLFLCLQRFGSVFSSSNLFTNFHSPTDGLRGTMAGLVWRNTIVKAINNFKPEDLASSRDEICII